jgi:hypothetical protein
MKAWRLTLAAAVAFLVAGVATAAMPPQQPAGDLPKEADSYIKTEPRWCLRKSRDGLDGRGSRVRPLNCSLLHFKTHYFW